MPAPVRLQDFRNCADGTPTIDAYDSSIAATAYGEVACSSSGMVFSGANESYVGLDAWSWGGVVSFETYVYVESTGYYPRIFEFASGHYGVDTVFMTLYDSTREAYIGGKSLCDDCT